LQANANAPGNEDDNEDDEQVNNEQIQELGYAIDTTSSLSAYLQLYPWPSNYKPRLSAFDGKSNPKKFIASFEAAVHSVGGDTNILAKSLIMAIEDIAHDWYTSLHPYSIKNWGQLKGNLLTTFQGYQSKAKTTRYMLKVSQDGESLAQYLQKLITIRAQIPNVQDDVVIAAAIEGLDIGQCASYLSREEPKTVNKLFEEIRKFAKSEEDLKRRKAIKRAPNRSTQA